MSQTHSERSEPVCSPETIFSLFPPSETEVFYYKNAPEVNHFCLCVPSISHILSAVFSHHLSPKGRILEESLIILSAHSIIPAQRLIHSLPLWRPAPPAEGEIHKKNTEHKLHMFSEETFNIFHILTGDQEVQLSNSAFQSLNHIFIYFNTSS